MAVDFLSASSASLARNHQKISRKERKKRKEVPASKDVRQALASNDLISTCCPLLSRFFPPDAISFFQKTRGPCCLLAPRALQSQHNALSHRIPFSAHSRLAKAPLIPKKPKPVTVPRCVFAKSIRRTQWLIHPNFWQLYHICISLRVNESLKGRSFETQM
jgi:hypothetical protein